MRLGRELEPEPKEDGDFGSREDPRRSSKVLEGEFFDALFTSPERR